MLRIGPCIILAVLVCSCGGLVSFVSHKFEGKATLPPFSERIESWQLREKASRLSSLEDIASPLKEEYVYLWYNTRNITSTEGIARKLNILVADISQRRYKPDGNGEEPADYWPTTEELFDGREKEDCDGLELLIYNFLTDRGYRAFRGLFGKDPNYHASTVVFEEENPDPIVIDSTGYFFGSKKALIHLSDLVDDGWKLIYLFTEDMVCKVEGEVQTCLAN